MAESRIAQLATSPLLTQFAVTASQKAIRPVGNFLAPLCEVPDLTFRYKVYTELNRFRIPDTLRQPGGKVTNLGFSADDATGTLTPNALNFPIPNVGALSDEGLSYSIMEAQSTLADVAALALEQQQINLVVNALTSGALTLDYSSNSNDPIGDATNGLDTAILTVAKAAKNGAPIKVVFGAGAFRKFRNNSNVRGRIVVGGGRQATSAALGQVSIGVEDVGGLLINNPQVRLSLMVVDTSKPGQSESINFLLDDKVLIFAASDTPNRMDPSLAKTFARMGGFFQPGSFVTEDQRDEVLKMDWFTLPTITNSPAGIMVKMS
jgi:hypothetical protein